MAKQECLKALLFKLHQTCQVLQTIKLQTNVNVASAKKHVMLSSKDTGIFDKYWGRL